MANLKIDISLGEAVDRLTILRIKLSEIKDNAKLRNISYEHDTLLEAVTAFCHDTEVSVPQTLSEELQTVNHALWKVEDDLREFERKKDFGEAFIEKARRVYFLNDRRAQIKKDINLKTNSNLLEEKSYAPY